MLLSYVNFFNKCMSTYRVKAPARFCTLSKLCGKYWQSTIFKRTYHRYNLTRYFEMIVLSCKHLFIDMLQSGGRSTVWVAVSIWVVALLLATPAAILTRVDVFQVKVNYTIAVCFPFPETMPYWYPQANVITKLLVYYVIPLLTIATFYLLMARHLIMSSNTVPGRQGIHKQMQTRRKVAKVVLCFVMIFAVCFLPPHVFIVWFYCNPNSGSEYDESWHIFRIVGFCLSFINSCINPLALYSISGTFRVYYNQYLFCWCCSKQSVPDRFPFQRGDHLCGSRYRSTSARQSCTMMITPLLRRPSNATTASIIPVIGNHDTVNNRTNISKKPIPSENRGCESIVDSSS